MRIRRASLIFENVLSKNGKCVYKELDKQFIELRNSVIKNDLYQTGAIFYKVNINGNIEISSNGSVGAKSRLIIDFIYEG